MHAQLLSDQFLRSTWYEDYERYCESDDENVWGVLRSWSNRADHKESSAEAALLQTFFVELWGYQFSGTTESDEYSIYPQYPITRAGQTGGTGAADVALGLWAPESIDVPQVLGEFKDIRSGLDVEQNRKGNTRSPVKQCADYLKEARASMWGNEPVQPTWAVVTDMNEFRLFHFRSIPYEYQRFVITLRPNDPVTSLVDDGDDARFQRFLFSRVFSAQWLLARRGKSDLDRLLDDQWTKERDLENEFYAEYRSYREYLYTTIKQENPGFSGTPGQLVRLTQRLLDRLIFLLYAEDIGTQLRVKPNFLRDLLVERAGNQFFDIDGMDVWAALQSLFRVLNSGGKLGQTEFYQFNGGLFRELPELQQLRIPNRVFCTPDQIRDPGAGHANKNTLLYFSTNYNFGYSPQNRGQSLSLYALGRIFEQSITEIEILEAQADGRESVNILSKRKRDGVYYTPEWVTAFIVENTIGTKLDQFRQQRGYLAPPDFNQEDIDKYQLAMVDRRLGAPKVISAYLEFLDRYEEYLSSLTVLDPACGSGAFLIQAFDRIYNEYLWIDAEQHRVSKQAPLASTEAHIKAILANNLHGVDINPESVEITKLALWLHTVRPNTPLSDLDRNIRCGNSLVAQDFYYDPGRGSDQQGQLPFQHEFTEFDEATRERINAFDWDVEFREIRALGGFDCIIGNPPYVKLQHFRKVESAMAEYLVNAQAIGKEPLYASTQTGNFDLYLPFIERGITLLNEQGVLGFIAPNVWLKNDYGKGLRRKVVAERVLDRWVEFGSFQVFEEATTYTSLQFYKRTPCDHVRFARATDGDVSGIEWGTNTHAIRYSDLPSDGSPLYLATASERDLMQKMESAGPRLDDQTWSERIVVGLQTSADDVYHLRRLGPNRYLPKAKGSEVVEIEDAIMHPLVSGPDTKRYVKPKPETYVLFPYEVSNGNSKLITQAHLQAKFPKAWTYLRTHEDRLRVRESNKFDDDWWYRFGRHQNIDKQETIKSLVPRLCERLHVVFDDLGEFYLDNVDVNGVVVSGETAGWYITGILNSSCANAYWRMISKPFRGGFHSANKQFIAPIPIPVASDGDRDKIVELAKRLQELNTEKSQKGALIFSRLDSRHTTSDKRSRSWILGTDDPDEQGTLLEQIESALETDGAVTASFNDGELSLSVGGVPVVDQVFVAEEEADFVLAQWRVIARHLSGNKRTNPSRFVDEFRTLRSSANDALRQQVIEADARIREMEDKIVQQDLEIEELVMTLYALDEAERAAVRQLHGNSGRARKS